MALRISAFFYNTYDNAQMRLLFIYKLYEMEKSKKASVTILCSLVHL